MQTSKGYLHVGGDVIRETLSASILDVRAYTTIGPVCTLVNQVSDGDKIWDMDFDSDDVEFGADNCATHHICAIKSLFIDLNDTQIPVTIKGIAGASKAEGIGTIKFRMTDDTGKSHAIQLRNVIYLPDAAKNLISISQWDEDNKDNCGINSRGTFSVFYWGNDQYKKTIHHPPKCKIPLLTVNERSKETLAMYFQSNSRNLIDEEPYSPNGIPPHAATVETIDDTDSDQQSDDVPVDLQRSTRFRVGAVVRSNIKGTPRISVITKAFRAEAGSNKYRIRHLNETEEVDAGTEELETIVDEPTDIPMTPADVDKQLLNDELTNSHVKALWAGNSDSTTPEAECVTLYWHHRLRHAPFLWLRRLAQRGVLPKCILK